MVTQYVICYAHLCKPFHKWAYGKRRIMLRTLADPGRPCPGPAFVLYIIRHKDSSHASRSGAIFRGLHALRNGVPTFSNALRFVSGSVCT